MYRWGQERRFQCLLKLGNEHKEKQSWERWLTDDIILVPTASHIV